MILLETPAKPARALNSYLLPANVDLGAGDDASWRNAQRRSLYRATHNPARPHIHCLAGSYRTVYGTLNN